MKAGGNSPPVTALDPVAPPDRRGLQACGGRWFVASKKRDDQQHDEGSGGQGTAEITARARSWPTLRQFAVFVENRVGRLHSLLRHLESHQVRIVALSIANSVDCAIVRLIVNDADRGREILELSEFSFAEIDLVGVELPEHPQPYLQICIALLQAEVNVQYTYPLLYRNRQGAIALYVDDVDLAMRTLEEKGLNLVTESDLPHDDF